MKAKRTIKQLLLCGVLCLGFTSIAQVGVGTITPHESSALEVQSTTKGFLPPRMTAVQMNAIVNPAEGLIVYCTDCTPKGVHIYDGSTYVNLMPQASATLNCGGTSVTGTAIENEALSGVTITIPYTGGNGQPYNAVAVASTGVTGLIATLAAGTLANGSGDLVLQVTGTPNGDGDTVFTIDTGVSSSSCTVTITALRSDIDTTTAVVDVTSTTGAVWMDRNLGATQVATSSTDAAAYGDLYQWGREKDGHEQRTSTPTATTATSAEVGHGDFILKDSAIDDNWTDFAGEDNLWQGESGINNPCPYGYRLPTEAEWDTERLSWSSNNAAGAFNSNLKLPLPGFRYASTGFIDVTGVLGYYWSSTVSGTNAIGLDFSSIDASTRNVVRTRGYSVRCIKD